MRASIGGAALTADQERAADAGLKAMMPIAGRPFLDHALHSLADAGFDEVGLVLAPAHDEVRAYYRSLEMSRIRIAMLTQEEPRGTADAVLAAEAWAVDAPFVVLNSDNLYPVDVLMALRAAAGPAVPGFERDSLQLPIDRIGAFALIEYAGPEGPRHRRPEGPRHRRCLSRIVEKPGVAAIKAAGPRALVSMNAWRFDARVFDACRDVPLSERGEKELPQAVGLAASRGVCFEVLPVRGRVLDLSRRGDVAEVARAIAGAGVNL